MDEDSEVGRADGLIAPGGTTKEQVTSKDGHPPTKDTRVELAQAPWVRSMWEDNNALGPELRRSAGRSALISDMVAQLKRGDITKAELFERLQHLQGATIASGAADTTVATATTVFVERTAASGCRASPSDSGAHPTSVPGLGVMIEREFAGNSPSSSGELPAVAAGTAVAAAATEAAVLFSAYDRQAIIQKIADERRRRAHDVRRSWPDDPTDASEPPQAPSAAETPVSSMAQSGSVSASNASLLQHGQPSSPSSLRASTSFEGAPSSSNPSLIGQNAGRPAAPPGNRQIAWEQSSEAPFSTYDTASVDDHPLPTRNRHGGAYHSSGRLRSEGHVSADDFVTSPPGSGPRKQLTSQMEKTAQRSFRYSSSLGSVDADATGNHSRRSSNRHCNAHGRRRRSDGSGGDVGDGGSAGTMDYRRSSKPSSSPVRRLSSRTSSDRGGARRGDYGEMSQYATASGEDVRNCRDRRRVPAVNGEVRKKFVEDPKSLSSSHEPLERLTSGVSPIPRREAWSHRKEGMQVDGRRGSVKTVDKRLDGSNGYGDPPDFGRGESWTEGCAWDEKHQWERRKSGNHACGEQASEMTVDEEAYRLRSFSEERARRGEELVRQELMSECTFRPKIKGLPQSYGVTKHEDAPFLERVGQWQRDKEKDAAARKADGKEKELESCTFIPHVNKLSRRAAMSRREALGEDHLPVDDRLHDESLRRDMDRSHLAAEQKAREEERLQEECTFTPDLATKRAAAAGEGGDDDWAYTTPRGRSRYRQAAAAVAAAAAATEGVLSGRSGAGGSSVWGAGRRGHGPGVAGADRGRHWELECCTFTPTVIGARKGMDQAQQYLQYDVVERLTGAAFLETEDADGAGSEEGDTLFGRAGDMGRMIHVRQQQQHDIGLPDASRAKHGRSRKTHGDSGGIDSTSFHAFLSRQNQMETNKLKHVEAIQEMQQHTFRPQICAESTKIHKESNKGEFLQRVARDAARKEHEAVRQQAAGKHDPECTFKPQITARSAVLQGRSVVELSRGDQLKRETTQRLTKLRAEQELLADTTFRPRTNANAVSKLAESRLKVVSDPDSYIATVETIRRRKEESAVKGAIQKAVKEVEGCTFRPQTTKCPAYITRIAQSISASKASAAEKRTRARPDWR